MSSAADASEAAGAPLASPSSSSPSADALRSVCIRGVPGWSQLQPQQIRLTQLRKGMTNQLFIAERAQECSAESEEAAEYRRVVVRVFGLNTGLFFDREYEEYITRRLSKRGIGSRILTEFGSGRIECFLEGRTLDCSDLSEPRISFLAAQSMATLHSKTIPITASLIDRAKRKVQRDARKLLPEPMLAATASCDASTGRPAAAAQTTSCCPPPPLPPLLSLDLLAVAV